MPARREAADERRGDPCRLSVDAELACATAAQRDLLQHMNNRLTDSTMTDRDRVVGATALL
jgi:hypothetical protein